MKPFGTEDAFRVVVQLMQRPRLARDLVPVHLKKRMKKRMKKTMKILLIDHETYRIESLARGLRIEGYEVLEARTLADALDLMKRHCMSIGLILSDCSTRILAYPQVLQTIQEELPHVRMVMMVDHPTGNGKVRSGSSWPIHFITKPFSEAELAQMLETLPFGS